MNNLLPQLALVSTALLSGAATAGDVDIVFLDEFESNCGNLIYSEPFTLDDGAAWPSPWSVLGNVDLADIQQHAARLRPMPASYALARMGAAVTTSNVEVRFTLRFEDDTTQGVGFYVRQNGGYLQNTMPHGQGYAAFAEGSFRGLPGIGVWKEIDGMEIQIDHQPSPYPTISAGVDYRVRFQVLQSGPTQTLVRAKMWPDGDPEPAVWQATTTDTSPELQNISGDIAIDSWSNVGTSGPITAHTFVDNVELISLCVP
ncbi:MAG: hypothetical protein WBV39_07820 [Rudaea sp.]